MAKKSRAKGESRTSAGDETVTPEPELYIPTPEEGGIIDFYYLFNGLGILAGIFMILYLLNNYVIHIF